LTKNLTAKILYEVLYMDGGEVLAYATRREYIPVGSDAASMPRTVATANLQALLDDSGFAFLSLSHRPRLDLLPRSEWQC